MAAKEIRLSIIIPCRNDAAALAQTLPGIKAGLLPDDEIIVSLAGPDEAATAVALHYGARIALSEKPGRGPQMNAGAAVAAGEALVFTHADTALTAAHLYSLRSACDDSRILCGAFFKDTRAHDPAWAWAAPVIRWWMAHCGYIYGDQSVFLRRSLFETLGGFASIPLMEDIDMSPRLRRTGGFRLIDPPLRTSMRGFARRGRFLTRLRNHFFILLFRSGVSAERLYRWYYGKPVDAPDPRS